MIATAILLIATLIRLHKWGLPSESRKVRVFRVTTNFRNWLSSDQKQFSVANSFTTNRSFHFWENLLALLFKIVVLYIQTENFTFSDIIFHRETVPCDWLTDLIEFSDSIVALRARSYILRIHISLFLAIWY